MLLLQDTRLGLEIVDDLKQDGPGVATGQTVQYLDSLSDLSESAAKPPDRHHLLGRFRLDICDQEHFSMKCDTRPKPAQFWYSTGRFLATIA